MKLIRNITLLFSLAAVPAMAQQTWQTESEVDIGNEQVVIVKERQNELPPANRSYQKVPPQEINVQQEQVRYNFSDYSLQLKPIDPTVRVLTIKSDPPSPYYNRYIKAGVGNYLSTYLDAWLNSQRHPSYLYGVHVNHQGAARGPVDRGNSSFSRNLIEANGSYFAKSLTFDSKIYAQRRRYNFYGYDEEALDPEKESLKQVYNMYGAEIGLSNAETERFGISAGLSAEHTGSFYNVRENLAKVDGKLRFNLSDALGIQLASDLLMSRYSNETDNSLNRNLFRIAPAFLFNLAPFQFVAGFNIAYENDTAANADQLHFYPRVELRIDPTANIEARLGFEGNMEPLTYRSLVNENPFLNQGIPLLHTNKLADFYGNIKGSVGGGVGFNAGFSAASYRNMYYFVNSHTDSTRFDVLYDSGNTSLVNIYGELSYHFTDRFQTSLRGDYYAYSPDRLVAAWHKPSYKVEWTGSYNLYEKILFSADTYVLGGIKAREIGTEDGIVQLSPIVDIGLGVEYMFSRQASAYLKADNLLSQNFERFYNYPSRRLIVSLGASYAF